MKIYIWDAVAGEGKFEIEYEDRYYEWHWKKPENIFTCRYFHSEDKGNQAKDWKPALWHIQHEPVQRHVDCDKNIAPPRLVIGWHGFLSSLDKFLIIQPAKSVVIKRP